jgi:hypothetical protein
LASGGTTIKNCPGPRHSITLPINVMSARDSRFSSHYSNVLHGRLPRNVWQLKVAISPSEQLGLCKLRLVEAKPSLHSIQFEAQSVVRLLRRIILEVNGLDQQSLRMPIGLGVDAGNKLVAQQEGKNIIAVLALVCRHIDLDPVTEAK